MPSDCQCIALCNHTDGVSSRKALWSPCFICSHSFGEIVLIFRSMSLWRDDPCNLQKPRSHTTQVYVLASTRHRGVRKCFSTVQLLEELQGTPGTVQVLGRCTIPQKFLSRIGEVGRRACILLAQSRGSMLRPFTSSQHTVLRESQARRASVALVAFANTCRRKWYDVDEALIDAGSSR